MRVRPPIADEAPQERADRLPAADLFRRQGLAGTGIKQILTQANAPFSSLYHHFPGGKDHLAASITALFDGAAGALEASDYADACPIATIALEVASTNEDLRVATAQVFAACIDAAARRLHRAGVAAGSARATAEWTADAAGSTIFSCGR